MSWIILLLLLVIHPPWFFPWCKAAENLLSLSSSAVQRIKTCPELKFSSVLTHSFKVCLVLWMQNKEWRGEKITKWLLMFGCLDSVLISKTLYQNLNYISAQKAFLMMLEQNYFFLWKFPRYCLFSLFLEWKHTLKSMGFLREEEAPFQFILQRMIFLEPWIQLLLVTDQT